MIELIDQHPRVSFFFLVPGEIDERSKILNNRAAFIANGTDEKRRPELAAILASIANFRAIARMTFKLGFNLCQSSASEACAIRKLKL